MKKFEVIENDLFNIANRLKLIDKNYLLVRNKLKKRFELWYNSCVPRQELVFKTNRIDKRMIDFVNETRIQNIDKIIKEIDEKNEKLRQKEINNAKNDCLDRMREVIKYVDR